MRGVPSPRRMLWALLTMFALAGIVAACTDRPTGLDRIAHRGIPQFNDPCPPGGCQLEGIVVIACPPGYVGEYPNCTPEDPEPEPNPCTTDPYSPGCGGDPCVSNPSASGCGGGGGGGTPTEPEGGSNTGSGETAEGCYDGNCYECPLYIEGYVITSLIPINDGAPYGTNNHEFKFSGRMTRVQGLNPAWFKINHTTSRDTWWIAESGEILLQCNNGRLIFGRWRGELVDMKRYEQLHLVAGPNHPYF